MVKSSPGNVREVPGSYGAPLVGLLAQSYSFLTDWQGFCDQRRRRYASTVFKASPGIRAIVLLEQQSLETIFDTRVCDKPYGFGPLRPDPKRIGHIRPTICSNGEAHDKGKKFVLELVGRRAATLAATVDEVASPYIERWAAKSSFDWDPDIDAVMSDLVFQWAVGTRLDPKDVSEWAYASLVVGPLWLPRPGTGKAVAQLNRMLDGVRAAPDFPAIAESAQRLAGLDADEAAKQLLFTLAFNSWGGLQGVLRSILGELFLNPEWADRAAAEVREALPAGRALSLEAMEKLPTVGWIVRETMRLHTPVQTIWGIPKEDLVVRASTGDCAVKKGELLMGVLAWANRNPEAFENPLAFDPGRFASEEADRNLVWAAGRDVDPVTSTNHMCAGRDVVYQVLTLFLAKLLAYRWTLSEKPDWGTGFSAASRPKTPVVCTSFTQRS